MNTKISSSCRNREGRSRKRCWGRVKKEKMESNYKEEEEEVEGFECLSVDATFSEYE